MEEYLKKYYELDFPDVLDNLYGDPYNIYKLKKLFTLQNTHF